MVPAAACPSGDAAPRHTSIKYTHRGSEQKTTVDGPAVGGLAEAPLAASSANRSGYRIENTKNVKTNPVYPKADASFHSLLSARRSENQRAASDSPSTISPVITLR